MNTGTTTTVDERIVEMRIDNEKFEAGAKKTISILESLDRSLNKIGSDNVDGFDNIEKSLDKVTDRFSAMGIVGDQIMRNLTNKAMELVGQLKNMSTMLTTQQIGAGWDKYAGKVEAVQTIMASTNNLVGEGLKWANQEEQLAGVTEQLQRLTWFADETSYSFSDMVNNVGKFTAAGRDLEESVTAMQGISTWAAISGGRPAEAGRAMYNLSQALGLGAVTQIDWKSIELANMATYEFKQQVIDVAEQMGTLKRISEDAWETAEGHTVTVESFRENLKDKWFNSDVLLEVLNNYGGFAQKVAAVQEKFDYDSATYVLSDLKAYEKMLEGDTEAADDLQKSAAKLGITIEDLKSDFEEMLRPEYDLGRRAFQAAQEAKTFQEAIDATRDAVSTKWMTVFELLFGNYLEAKELWTQMSEVFWNIFAGPVDHLIEIIEGARGFLGEHGFIADYTEGMTAAAGSTAMLEDRLSALGKNMDDFCQALNKTMGPKQVKQIVDDYGSLEEALRNGAITVDQFKKALGALDDTYQDAKKIGLNRALNKAGKSMTDFEKAIEGVADRATLDLIENFGGVEEALKRGGISVELFKKALDSLGIDSENVSAEVEQNAAAAVGSIAEMRELALEVLRGDHGNGDERLAWYESMGLDPELMQAMVGDLKNIARAGLDDDYLLEIMESYYQANNLQARLGYATFAEYLASCMGATEEYAYDMNSMAEEADDIYASLFGEGVIDKATGDYVSAGELFRTSISNLLEALDNFGAAFDEAFLRIFGGSDDYDESIGKMSNGFFTLTAAFYSFTERVKAFSESESFLNFMTAVFSVARLIGKALGIVFKIGKAGLSVVMKLLSPILKLATGIFELVTTGLDAISRTIDDLGILNKIDELGSKLRDKIAKPIEKINKAIDTLIDTFLDGFKNGGGIVGGMQNVTEAMDQMLENHPVLQAVIHALSSAFSFLADVVTTLAIAFGGLFGGAIALVIAAFGKLGEWFGQFVIWAQSSELLNGIWQALTTTFQKIGRVLKRVFGYAEQGFQEGGFFGAFIAVSESFERGVKRLVPGGEKIVEIFNTIKSAISGLFKTKEANEDGLSEMVDGTNQGVLKLTESLDTFNNLTRAATEGAFGDEEQQKTFKDRIKTLVANLWDGFLEGLREIKIGDVISALRLGVIANVLLKVGHGLNLFNDFADNISDIPLRIGQVLEDLGWTLRSLAFDFKANAILKFAAAVGIVAGAIWILSRIPSEQLEKASSVTISILMVLSLLAVALSKTSASIFQTIQYMPALGAALIGFAMTISSIGTTALILALVSRFVGAEHLKAAATTIMMIIGTIAALIAVLVAIVVKNKDLSNGYRIEAIGTMIRRVGFGLIGIALAVQMLTAPILLLSAVLKFARGSAGLKKFRMAVGSVVAIILTIGTLVSILSFAINGFTAEQIRQLGTFIIKVGVAIMILALAINMLTMPMILLAAAQKYLGFNINGIIGAISVLAILGSLIALLLVIFGGVMSNKQEAQIKATGTMLIKFAASLALVAVAVGLLVAPIIKITQLSEQMETKHIIGALGLLVVTIGILVGILALINGLILKGKGGANSLGLGKGLYRIAAAITLMAAAALLLAPAIILLAGAIGIFTYMLGRLTESQWQTFEKGLERLGKFSKKLALFGAALMIVGLAATLTGTGIIGLSVGILVLAAAIGVMMVAFPKVVEAFKKLEEIDDKKITKSIGKAWLMLGGLLIAMTLFAYAVSRIYSLLGGGTFRRIGQGFVETIKNMALGVRSGVRNGFTKAVEFLKDEKNKETILAALATLVTIGAGYVAGILPTVAHVIIGGLIDLLNSVAAEISDQAPGIVEALNNIVSALVKVAAGLFDSVFGTNFLTKLTESEEALDRVTGVVEGLGIIVAGLNLISPFKNLITTLTGTKGVTAAIGSVSTAASATDEIMLALSGSSAGYFASLLPTILGIVAGAAIIGGIIWGVNKFIKDRKEELEEERVARNEEFFGEADPDVEKRAEKLEEINGYYVSLLEKEQELKDKMLKAQQDHDQAAYDEASQELIAMGEELAYYRTQYGMVKQDLAKELAAETHGAYGTWLDIKKEIEATGGDLSQVAAYQRTHIDDISVVAEEIAKTKEEIRTLANGVIDDDVIYRTSLLQEKLDQLESTYNDLVNRQTESAETSERTASALDTSSAVTEKFAQRSRQAVETVTEVQTATVAATNDVEGLKERLSELGFTGSSSIRDVIASLGDGKFQELINEYMPDLDLSAFGISGIDDFKSMLGDVGLDVGEFLDGGVGDGMLSSSGLASIFDGVLGIKNATLDDLWAKFEIGSPSRLMAREVGQYIPAGIGEGIKETWYTAVNPLYTLMDEMTNTFSVIRERFVDSGAQIISGLVQGLNLNMQSAYDSGQALAASIENGFRDRLLIRSPSRVFADLARYIPMGVSDGIEAGENGAIDSIVVFGNELVNAIMRSMAMVSTVANDEFDFQPHITPVVDLSNVSSAAGMMNSAFGGSYSMPAQMTNAISRRMDNVERIASAMNNQQTINNGDNITFNIYQQPGEDANALADAVLARMNTRLARRGVAFG